MINIENENRAIIRGRIVPVLTGAVPLPQAASPDISSISFIISLPKCIRNANRAGITGPGRIKMEFTFVTAPPNKKVRLPRTETTIFPKYRVCLNRKLYPVTKISARIAITRPAVGSGQRRARDIVRNINDKVLAALIDRFPEGSARRGWFIRSLSRSRISFIMLPNPHTKKAIAIA